MKLHFSLLTRGDLGNVHGYGLGFKEKRSAGDFFGLSDKQGGSMLLLGCSMSLSS
jgi:hypothetical protein